MHEWVTGIFLQQPNNAKLLLIHGRIDDDDPPARPPFPGMPSQGCMPNSPPDRHRASLTPRATRRLSVSPTSNGHRRCPGAVLRSRRALLLRKLDRPAPAGWRIDYDATKFKLVWQGALPVSDEAPEIVRLYSEFVPLVMELVAAASPGPFGPRTIEMGEFYGWFEGQRLVAMVGGAPASRPVSRNQQRLHPPGLPGPGIGTPLTTKLIRQQMLRNESRSCKSCATTLARHKLYERMGFSVYREANARIVTMV